MSKQFTVKLVGSRSFLHSLGYFFFVFLCFSFIPTSVSAATLLTGATKLWGWDSVTSSISGGSGNHSCAVVGGGVKCWGENSGGQLGNNSTTNSPAAVDVKDSTGIANLTGISAVGTGKSHTCALTTGNGVKCWGSNQYGQLGDGSAAGSWTNNSLLPVDVTGLTSGVSAIAVGESHTCALVSGGVKCWGTNGNGQIGDAATAGGYGTGWGLSPVIIRTTPSDVSGLGSGSGVVAIAAGDGHSCALMNTSPSTVKCWAWNNFGQLGNGTTVDTVQPFTNPTDVVTNITGPVYLTNVIALGAALGHTCALISGGGVKCWGMNGLGRLGDGTTTNRYLPVDVVTNTTGPVLLSGATQLAVGATHGCVLVGGGVKCWGWNIYGQLGDGTTTNHHVAADVPSLTSGVSAISANYWHSCALISATGGVKCWGYNSNGGLGNGSTGHSYSPVDVVIASPPNPPTALTATPVSQTQINLAWTDNSTDETGFKIESPAGTPLITTAANAVSYNHTGLTCGSTYNYNVMATNATGDSTAITASATTQACSSTPPPPTGGTSTPSYTVITQVAGTGTGSIAQTNVAVSSGQTAKIQLTAIPATGSKFVGWSNSFAPECVGSSPNVTVTVNAIKTCIATFEIIKQSGFRSSIMDTGALDFGNIPIAINRSFTISENGNIDLIISNPTLSGDNASDFKIITPQFPLTIPDGAPAQIITVQCKPSSEGTRTAQLQFTTNDPQNPTVQYALNCNATSLDIGGAISVPTAKYSSLPVVNQAIMFGSALIGQAVNSSIAISELGNAPLEVTFKDMIGPHRNDFKIISGLPATIADGGAGQNIQVQCTPSDTGVRVAILQLATNDVYQTLAGYTLVCSGESPNAPTYTLTLNTTGNGTINNCGVQCSQTHAANSSLTLLTSPANGWQFHEWTGDCASNGQIEITHDKTCTANFTQMAAPNIPTTPTLPTLPSTPGITVEGAIITPVQNGYVTQSTHNYGRTATDVIIETTGSVAGGILAGQITNRGLVANITVADDSTLIGGKFSGFSTNQGTLQDITVSQYSQIQGGNYAGTITNNGTLLNPILLPNAQILNNGVLDNPVILPGAQVTGGKMTGMTIILGTLENVQLAPSVQVVTQVKDIPPAVFSQFNAQTLAKLPASMLSQVTPAQFAQIPTKSLSGLKATNMGGLSPQVVQSMNQAQIAALQPEEFKQMPEDGVAKLLTNFDSTAITPQEAEKLLPKDWKIDLKTGDLTAPPGSPFNLKAVKLPTTLPSNLTVPSLPDLNSSFALSGKGTAPVLPQLNQILAKEGVLLAQQNTGILHAEVAGSTAVTTKKKNRFAFMIDPNYLFILTEEALRGLKINEQGQYVLVTDDGKEIPITPMTQDPEGLLSILSEDATIDIRPTGEVLIKHIPNQRARDGEEVHSVGMFDPFIEPAPEDICQEDAKGEMQCDWSKADATQQPGLRSARNVRAKVAAKIIYPDGSSQNLYPAVLFPDILVAEAKKMKGVEKAIFRMDGTFAVTYQGTKLLLLPEFDTQVQPIPAGKKFQPSLTLQPDGRLLYQVPYLDQLFSTTLVVIEAPTAPQ